MKLFYFLLAVLIIGVASEEDRNGRNQDFSLRNICWDSLNQIVYFKKAAKKCFPMASTGLCLASIPRYTFAGNKCVQFTYGGCGYDDNNFGSQMECEAACLNFVNEQANPDFKLVTE